MIRLDAQPGRLVVRSRTVPTWALVVLVVAHVPLLAMLAYLGPRVPRVVALECDRGAGRCVRTVDGEPVSAVPLAEVTRTEVRTDRARRSSSLLVATRSGRTWTVIAGERRNRVERDAAVLEAFLAGAGPGTLRLEWDHGLELLATFASVPAIMLAALFFVSRPTVATVDCVARSVRVRWFRARARPLGGVTAVRVQTGAEDVEDRRRQLRERTGREPGIFGPRADPRRASARRVVVVGEDGVPFPVTAWLLPREDPGPAAERLRAFLGVG
jgi:hypothetical protein